jgi:hypothetical protein
MECWPGRLGRGRRPLCERESSISAWCGGRGIDVCRCEREPQYPLLITSLLEAAPPASATAPAMATGSLGIRTLESFSPAALNRTITDRRR